MTNIRPFWYGPFALAEIMLFWCDKYLVITNIRPFWYHKIKPFWYEMWNPFGVADIRPFWCNKYQTFHVTNIKLFFFAWCLQSCAYTSHNANIDSSPFMSVNISQPISEFPELYLSPALIVCKHSWHPDYITTGHYPAHVWISKQESHKAAKVTIVVPQSLAKQRKEMKWSGKWWKAVLSNRQGPP